jgi:DNA replication protein DnaC
MVMANEDFKRVTEYLKSVGSIKMPDQVFITIPDAKEMLMRGINYFTNNNGVWLPEYEHVASWLSNNEGKGLFCMGKVGRGKSLICTKVIPVLLSWYCRKIVSVYDAQQMNVMLDNVLSKHIICIDDLGTEEVAVNFGNRRMAFAEIADAAEKEGKLLIITTNMTIDQFREKYGERVIDRLRVLTKSVLFNGESLRK